MEDSTEQNRKLFLGGLNYATTEDSLTTHFSQWGTLVDCIVMRFPDSRRSRGFGFITYSNADEAEACFGAIPHTVDGTQIEIKRSTPKGEKGAAGPKGEVLRKIFIGGLTYSTTDEGLKTYFEQYGEVVDCVVMKYKDSDRSRGFGFVTYSSTDMVDEVQKNRPHTIDGTKVETKRATPREEAGQRESGKSAKKVFVGGLKDDIEDKDLEEYFAEFGTVVSAEQMTDKATGKKRGFGFIEFDDYDPVDRLLQQPRHEINGHKVDIKKALGRNELNQGGGGYGGGRQASWGGNQGYGGGFGGDYGGGYGANSWGGGNNPWQGGWGDQGGNDWSGGNGGGGYMTSGGGWGGGYGGGGAGGAMRNSQGGGGNRSAPYSVGGRGGGGRGRGGAPAGGSFY